MDDGAWWKLVLAGALIAPAMVAAPAAAEGRCTVDDTIAKSVMWEDDWQRAVTAGLDVVLDGTVEVPHWNGDDPCYRHELEGLHLIRLDECYEYGPGAFDHGMFGDDDHSHTVCTAIGPGHDAYDRDVW